MKRNIKFYSVASLISLMILAVSPYFEGFLSYAIYAAAFLFPIISAEAVSVRDRRIREEESGCAIPYRSYFEISKRGLCLSLPLLVPSVALIALFALMTSLFMGAFGYTQQTAYEGSFVYLLVSYALTPAILEELLFRYLPMKLFLPYSPRAAVVISAVTFGFYHMDIFKIPYAILAGAIFMTLDIMADSVWPSVIIHFVNNALSLTLIRYSSDTRTATVIYAVLGVLLVLSAVAIAINAKGYKAGLSDALSLGREYTYHPSVLALPAVSTVYVVLTLIN